MKKTIIISVGVIFLLLLIGVWAYLFFVGTPESVDEVFSDLNIGSEPAPITPTNDEIENTTNDNPSDTPAPQNTLSQLTTAPVAGFTFLNTNASSSATELMYVEKGTGHVYHYHLDNQQRTRISNQTIPTTQAAYIDTDGEHAVLETTTQLRIIPLTTSTTSNEVALPGQHQNIHLGANDTLYYTQTDQNGTTGYTYDITNDAETRLFSAPLQDVKVLWNENGTHHLYNATAETLPGYLYRVSGNTLRRTAIAGNSLEVMYGPEANSFLYTTQEEDNTPISRYWSSANEQRLSAFVRPEKCTTANQTTYCAFSVTDTTNITEWYRGGHQFSDDLWQIDHNLGSSRLVVDFSNQSGRDIDVDAIQVDATATTFLLRNKRDGFLWTYIEN